MFDTTEDNALHSPSPGPTDVEATRGPPVHTPDLLTYCYDGLIMMKEGRFGNLLMGGHR